MASWAGEVPDASEHDHTVAQMVDEPSYESHEWRPPLDSDFGLHPDFLAADEEQKAAISEGLASRDINVKLSPESYSMTSARGGTEFASRQNQLSTHSVRVSYSQHRAHTKKLEADFKRIQKLESQARSRLDRIRTMKDQLTDRMQISQQQFLDRLAANDSSMPLHFESGAMKIGSPNSLSREATVKSEPFSATIDEVESLEQSQGCYLDPSLSSEFRTTPASSISMFSEARHKHARGLHSETSSTTRHHNSAECYDTPPDLHFQSVLAPLKRKEEPDYQPLSRDALPQIDDAEATAIILEARLKGNARHRAGPNYFRRKGPLYVDKYYLLEQRDKFGRLIISHEKAVGCFDTARYRYQDESEE